MSYPVLGRRDEALTPAETEKYLRDRLGDGVLDATEEYGTFTVTVTPAAWVEATRICKDADLLAYDLFDSLFGVDRREDGFDVIAILYSTSRGRRILLRVRADGGRDAPVVPTLTGLYPGANWHERETWDMFGIEFDGHPGLAPRILCVENFEGWPLRKDFHLGTRVAKPWPGVKEPAELDEDGNVIVRIPGPGDAPGPSVLDEVMAAQAKTANPPTVDPEPVVDTASPAPADEVADEVAAEVDEATKDAAVKAEEVRLAQAQARADKAAEPADAPAAAGEGPVVPEGVTPDEDAAADEDES
jgi:NADH:ubiquinone oxidoreductase subunit C